jgi:Tfp pilus assembly protein PilX
LKLKPHKSGFALVIALSLMAFVLLLLLSITTLVQVESRSAQNTQQQTQARMNALLGLQQALGELQRAAGHDQRVTATGDLWVAPAVGTEHLVGVWSSEDADGDGQPDGAFQRWLVSNDDDNAATPDAKADSVNFVTLARPVANDGSGGYIVTNPDFVALVGAGSVAQNDPGQSPQAVVAQKRSILSENDQSAGNYAWWVGDNGVKATITQADPYASGQRTGTEWAVNANMLSMQGSAVSALSDFASLDLSDEATVGKLQRSASLSDVELVDSAITLDHLKEHFHDLTTSSLGLQTNTRHGGLKRDLSLLFEMSDADFDDPNGHFITAMAAAESEGAGIGGHGLVYNNPSVGDAPWVEKSKQALLYKYPISGGAVGDGVIYGPSFGMLRDYYRLYKGITNKQAQPSLQEGWVHTYQPSKARVMLNGNGGQSGNQARAKARKYTLGLQGWRKYAWDHSPETSQSGSFLGSTWGGIVSAGDPVYAIRPTKGSYTPYLSRVTNVFALTSKLNGATDANGESLYDFDIIWQPHLTLHNPYNVRVVSQRMRYTSEFRHLKIKEIITEQYDFDTGTYAPEVVDAVDLTINPGDWFRKNQRDLAWEGSEMVLEIPAGVVFEPGEVKVFAVDTVEEPSYHSSILQALRSSAAADTGGIHFGVAQQYAEFADFAGSTKVEIKFKLEKAGSQFVDIWNPELNDWDAMFSVKFGEEPRLFGNVDWDDGGLQRYRDTVDTYEASAIASLVFDDFVKPLSFSESLGGGGTLVEVQGSRKLYPNFMLTNPMATSFHEWGSGGLDGNDWSGVFHSYAESFIKSDAHPRSQIRDGSSRGGWGYNHGNDGPTHSVLLELPTAPMQSLGQFQHAILHPMPYFSAKAVGNSFSSPFVSYHTPVSASGVSNANADGIVYTFVKDYGGKPNAFCFYDFSYLLNDVLWDGYYFSSIAPAQSLMNRSYALPSDVAGDEAMLASSMENVVSDFVAGHGQLRNVRMQLLSSELSATEQMNELLDFQRSAKHLAVSGAFNVNSTSVAAWKVFLSGYRGASLAYSGKTGVLATGLDPGETAFPGMSLAPGAARTASANITSDAAWAGFMKLDESAIADLAEAIVAQIKARAVYRGQQLGNSGSPTPSLSLGQFVNRMNGDPHSSYRDLTQGGSLQQAIVAAGTNDSVGGLSETTFEASEFNQSYSPKPLKVSSSDRDYYPDQRYTIDVRHVSPLTLTQADILQAIGPAISARSDTFTIRSYGDVEDTLSGNVVAQVWCEATVQRTSQKVDGVNQPNQRMFKVVGFRWLTPDEV